MSTTPSAASAGSQAAGSYIVVLEDGVASAGSVATEHARAHGAQVGFVYEHALRGYSATMSPAAAARIARDARVAYVEPDGVATVAHHRDGHTGGPGGIDGGTPPPAGCTQALPWGIDTINADLSSAAADACLKPDTNVTNVHVYVIDTGVDTSHADLNVVGHVNFAGGPNKDCNGHGTHVAGTMAATDNDVDVVGVVPGAPVVGVKVLGCGGSGTWSGVIAGIDWVKANAVKPAVANMSLGGGASTSVDNAVKDAAASGVVFSIAAGNSGAEACDSSPARAGKGDNGIITTAATDSSDNDPYWSNDSTQGCIDLWAPGVSILSTANGGGTTTKSGTSMAAPHAGGGAGLYLSANTAATVTQVEQALKATLRSSGKTSNFGNAIQVLDVATF